MYRLSEKVVIVVNGKGGVGKDTLCGMAGKYFICRTVSAITPILHIARYCGWNGEKDEVSRKFLSDLKRTMISYNNLPTRYLENEYASFANENKDILFVQIREKDQIDDFRRLICGRNYSLLIRSSREGLDRLLYHNDSDDNAELLPYDFIFDNNAPLEQTPEIFSIFLRRALVEKGVNVCHTKL